MSSTISESPPNPGLAYGVDPRRQERYSLRQARFFEIGQDLGRYGLAALQEGRQLQVLDIGAGEGTTLRHLEAHAGRAGIELSGADIKRKPGLYRPEEWKNFWIDDLMAGLPLVPSKAFDIVVCEEVLEHLIHIDLALAAFNRILRPGGIMICGVPIFPPGMDSFRKVFVPMKDRLLPLKKPRGHVQSFSKNSFIQ